MYPCQKNETIGAICVAPFMWYWGIQPSLSDSLESMDRDCCTGRHVGKVESRQTWAKSRNSRECLAHWRWWQQWILVAVFLSYKKIHSRFLNPHLPSTSRELRANDDEWNQLLRQCHPYVTEGHLAHQAQLLSGNWAHSLPRVEVMTMS